MAPERGPKGCQAHGHTHQTSATLPPEFSTKPPNAKSHYHAFGWSGVRMCSASSAGRGWETAPETRTEMRRKARDLLLLVLLIHIGNQSWKKALMFCSTQRCEALPGMKILMICSTKRCDALPGMKILPFPGAMVAIMFCSKKNTAE